MVVTVLAAVVATSALAASAPTRTSFAAGSWSGSARLSQTIEGFAFTAKSTFTMQIRNGRASGTVVSRGSGSGRIQGQTLRMAMTGGLPLAGRPGAPSARGNLKFTATIGGQSQSGVLPAVATLTKLRGTCDRMTGKLSYKLADATQLLTAPFTATRARGGAACS